MSKFEATPEGRTRLRVQFAEADRKDAGRVLVSDARARRGPLIAVPDDSGLDPLP